LSVQAVIIMVGALGLMISTIVLVRRRLLSIRYGFGWLAVSLIGFVGAPLLSLAASQVSSLGFTATGFSLGIFIMFLGLICLQLSISLSGLHRAIQDLAESAALVEHRLTALERTRLGQGEGVLPGEAHEETVLR
jgi:Na+/melibiose symporter-like transporter